MSLSTNQTSTLQSCPLASNMSSQSKGPLPDGWRSAEEHFEAATQEQLSRADLPDATGERHKLLRYIYTDGLNYVYCRGGYGCSKWPENVYSSWSDAYSLGAKKYRCWKSKQRARSTATAVGQNSICQHQTHDATSPQASVLNPPQPAADIRASWQPTSALTCQQMVSSNEAPEVPAGAPDSRCDPLTQVLRQSVNKQSSITASAAASKSATTPSQSGKQSPAASIPPAGLFADAAPMIALAGTAAPSIVDESGAAEKHQLAYTPLRKQQVASSPSQAGSRKRTALHLRPTSSGVAHEDVACRLLQPLVACAKASPDTRVSVSERVEAVPAIALPSAPLQQQQHSQLTGRCCQMAHPSINLLAERTSMMLTRPDLRTAATCPSLVELIPGGTSANTSGRKVASFPRSPLDGRPYHRPPVEEQMASSLDHACSDSRATEPGLSNNGIHVAAELGTSRMQPLRTSEVAELAEAEPKAACETASKPAASQTEEDMAAITGAPAASTSGVRHKPIWDWPMHLCEPRTLLHTGQQVLVSVERNIGSGGCGEVMEVKVKLYGQDSLAAIKQKCQALSSLLQRSSCNCGAVPPDAQQGADSNADNCSCSVLMALKAAILYEGLPAAVRQALTSEKYKMQTEQQMYAEYSVMDKCESSQHVIDCYALGSQLLAGVQRYCLLMELSQLGTVEQNYSLAYTAHGLDAVQTQKLVSQVTAGVSDMHQLASALHRDVKWSNVLLFGDIKAPRVKLCDFGVSKRLVGAGRYAHTVVGTLDWAAPEQADSSVGQDWRLDTYQLGLLVLALRTGRLPLWWLWHERMDLDERARKLLDALVDAQSPYNHTTWSHTALGPVEKAFVTRCLNPNISRRPSATELMWNDPYLRRMYAGG